MQEATRKSLSLGGVCLATSHTGQAAGDTMSSPEGLLQSDGERLDWANDVLPAAGFGRGQGHKQ